MKNRIATGEAIRSLWIESQSTPARITRKSDAGVTLSHHVGCGHSLTPPVSGPTQPNLRRSLHKHHRRRRVRTIVASSIGPVYFARCEQRFG